MEDITREWVKENETECFSREVWKDIPGFEGEYMASTLGRIKSLKRGKGVIRKLTTDSYGYKILVLIDKVGKRHHVKAHRMIAITFVPNPNKHETVNHKNGNKSDNSLDNLEWMTFSENSKHGWDSGAMRMGERHALSKLTDTDVIEIINANNAGFTTKEISSAFGVSYSSIRHILRGETWKSVTSDIL